MQEIITKAVILDRLNTGEVNSFFTLYTKELGLVKASAKSARNLTSKLSGHLEPLTISNIRLVKKNQFIITDALTEKNFKTLIKDSNLDKNEKINRLRELLGIFSLIKEVAALEQPDEELWDLVENGKVFNKEILKILGFDPDHATCNSCEASSPKHFILRQSYYLCLKCFHPSEKKIMLK